MSEASLIACTVSPMSAYRSPIFPRAKSDITYMAITSPSASIHFGLLLLTQQFSWSGIM